MALFFTKRVPNSRECFREYEFGRKKTRIYRNLYTNAFSFDNVYSKLKATRAFSSFGERKMGTSCRTRIIKKKRVSLSNVHFAT